MKYVKLFGGFMTVTMLSACYSATADDFVPVSMPSHITATARDQVSYALNDPDSAQFRNIRGYAFSGPGGGYVVCGEVNGRNRLGGYAGFQPFRTSVGNGQSSGQVYINDLPAVSMPCSR